MGVNFHRIVFQRFAHPTCHQGRKRQKALNQNHYQQRNQQDALQRNLTLYLRRHFPSSLACYDALAALFSFWQKASYHSSNAASLV